MNASNVAPELLLHHLDELLRSTPNEKALSDGSAASAEWSGRACAVMERWNGIKGLAFRHEIDNFNSRPAEYRDVKHYKNMLTWLHHAKSDLQLQTSGPLSISLPKGGTYSYFDEIRKIVQTAKSDVFFIDPYLDADFVSRYLPFVSAGVSIRLLTCKKLTELIPAVQSYKSQHGAAITVKSSKSLHDRFVLIDGVSCYQSGASFKDGGKMSPVTLTQITDAFVAMKKTYEDIWSAAAIQCLS